MHWSLSLVTPPAEEPLTLADAKEYARVDHNTEDQMIQGLIQAARELVEQRGICVHEQTWELALDRFPVAIMIPKAPLQSVVSITYTDTDGNAQVLATSQYQVDTRSTPARIVPAYGVSWPVTRLVPNAVVVQFVAGLDPGQPELIREYEKIRQYMREAVRAMYDREPIPEGIGHLLDNQLIYCS